MKNLSSFFGFFANNPIFISPSYSELNIYSIILILLPSLCLSENNISLSSIVDIHNETSFSVTLYPDILIRYCLPFSTVKIL